MTPSSEGPASPTPVRVVSALPVLVPVLVTALALSAMTFVLLESYSLLTVVPLALVLGAIGLRVAGLGDRVVDRKDLRVDVLALLLALGFSVFNAGMAAQDVTINRDPAIYANASQWLVHHDSLDIDGELDQFGSPPTVHTRAAGIGPMKDEPFHLYAQGAHVLPGVLGVSGRLFGTSTMLKTNALLGGLALLAVYGFARRLTGRWGALLVMGVLGLGLPQLAFSRDTYSEPISQLFVFGGLALLWQARRGEWGRWALAGVVLGGSCMARIDAFLLLPALIAYVGLQLSASVKGQRSAVVRDVVALSVGVAVPSVMGFLDLTRMAPGYYRSLSDEYHLVMLGVAASLVVTALIVVVAWVGGKRVWDEVYPRIGGKLGVAAMAIVVLGAAFLASRPLWLTYYGVNHPPTIRYVGALQRRDGLDMDVNRLYFENSMTWLAWYLGPLLVVLGVVGLALLARRATRETDLRLVPFALAMVSVSGYYLWDPNIAPDQIWAMRRFVPVILPGVAICGVYAGVLLVRRLSGRARPVVAGLGLAALLGPVFFITQPLLTVREYVPQLLEINRVCEGLPDDAAIVAVGEMEQGYPMTLRSFCLVPAAGAPKMTAQLAKTIQASLDKHDRQLYVLADEDVLQTVEGVDDSLTPVSQVAWRVWRPILHEPARFTDPQARKLFLGKVGPDGVVTEWVLAQ